MDPREARALVELAERVDEEVLGEQGAALAVPLEGRWAQTSGRVDHVRASADPALAGTGPPFSGNA